MATCLVVGRTLYEGVTWLAVVLLCGELAARAVQTTLRWVLRVFGRFEVEAIAMSAERLLTLVLGVAVLLGGGGVPGLVAVFAAVRAANALGLLAWVRGHVLPLRARADPRAWHGLLRDGLPLAFSGACLSLVVQLDSVLLERLAGAREVGLYRAPLRITEGLMLVPRAVAAAALPAFPALYSKDARSLDAPYRLAAALLLLAGLAIAVPGLGAPGPVVRLVFGPAYEDATGAARLLLLAVVPAFLAVLGEIVLASVGRGRAIAGLTAAALGLNALLVLVLVPRHGLMGASAATLAGGDGPRGSRGRPRAARRPAGGLGEPAARGVGVRRPGDALGLARPRRTGSGGGRRGHDRPGGGGGRRRAGGSRGTGRGASALASRGP